MTITNLPRRLASYPNELPDIAQPFTEEINLEHPSPDGGDDLNRLVLARTTQMWRHDQTDAYDHVPVAAVYWEGLGESVEIGPWSMSTDDALVLARHLTELVAKARKLVHTDCNCAEMQAEIAELVKRREEPDENVW